MKDEVGYSVFAQKTFYVGRPLGRTPPETGASLSMPMQPVASAKVNPAHVEPKGFEVVTRLSVKRRKRSLQKEDPSCGV
ncbi:hypothetical protein LAB1_45370 [Roseibium sp. LAB1]